jgi:hypothetical protein
MLVAMGSWTQLLAAPGPAPDLLVRDDVLASTWTGVLADRAYRLLGRDVALRADLRPVPELRAQAIQAQVPARAAVFRRSACWVLTGGVMPARVELVVEPGARRVGPSAQRVSHETHLDAHDVLRCAGIVVTTPTRTVLDLLLGPGSDDQFGCVRRLLDIGADIDEVRRRLDTGPRRPGNRQARELARAAASQTPWSANSEKPSVG